LRASSTDASCTSSAIAWAASWSTIFSGNIQARPADASCSWAPRCAAASPAGASAAPRSVERDAAWPRREPLGVIAGTLSLGLGRALGALPGENDGVVCVDETVVDGMSGRVLVREAHSMLPVSPRTSALVERFLATGRFA
jgi:hypothetical protein